MMAGPELYQPGLEVDDAAWDRARPSNWGRGFVPEQALPKMANHLGHLNQ